MYMGFHITYMLILFMAIFLKIPTNCFYMSSCKVGIAVNYKEIVTLREDESNLVMDIKVHEFVNKDTWQLHLALHANGVLIGVAFANPGNTKYDNETVVAAMQSLKNDYYEAIGSPMRYQEGKLTFLPADQGLIAKRSHMTPEMEMEHASHTGKTVALSH
ncbi:hypothetical protein SAMN04488696_0340 [Methanolobus profundi]|uniref:Uncharacterized protein n=2 Tax=Methanolobus profundi TaxID=487685 RepID=A0A1I4NYB8_9EURY|nr:hypothetical protein SAMN04488696_0340 [Methanolobus profundi]